MANLEVSFPYKAIGMGLFTFLCACWAVLGLAASGLLQVGISTFEASMGLAHDPWWFLARSVLFILCCAVYAYVPFAFLLKRTHGNHLFCNKDGFGIPGKLLGPPSWLSWSEMQAADVVHYRSWSTIQLSFTSGRKVSLHTNRMKAADLEQLLMSFEVWAVKAVWSQALLDFRDSLQNKKVGIEGPTYTQLWEGELRRRFNTTTFVPLEPGAKVHAGTIKILKQIAFGGFSAVYLGEDANKQKLVIKESVTASENESENEKDSGNLDEKALELFKREAVLLGKLNDNRLARVLDSFTEGGRTYLVLEYIPGENLREYVKRNGAQSESTVLELMLQMANILQYLHDQDPPVVHRDFTPDNIVLKQDGSLILIDFGAANEFLSNATGTLVGKQSYMPPEQVRGKSEPRSDLYALGCTAHFLLTANDPEPLSVCHPRSTKHAVSERLDQLVAKLTAQEVSDRFEKAADAINELEQMINSQVISIKSPEKELVERPRSESS